MIRPIIGKEYLIQATETKRQRVLVLDKKVVDKKTNYKVEYVNCRGTHLQGASKWVTAECFIAKYEYKNVQDLNSAIKGMERFVISNNDVLATEDKNEILSLISEVNRLVQKVKDK
jgi:hypothetical protein